MNWKGAVLNDRGAAGARRRAGHRLSADVVPHDYALHVDVDPERGSEYRGDVTIAATLRTSVRSIELHAAELRVGKARVATRDGAVAARALAHPGSETISLQLAKPVGPGEVELSIAFSGKLRDNLRGLYAASAQGKKYAITQLEAADARRFFPCFDEPAMKARFRIAVTTGASHQVISNAPVVREVKGEGGAKTVHFAATPPLSTYLVALAVGPFERSAATKCGPTEIRVWHVPGKGALTGFALEAARETLARLEKWFGLPYPYGKLDLVAAPDFEAGAMENAGAVFFRETLLLLDPATATLAEKKRAAEVICHELAHMWYGDLVTMAWWDDLWLNESFATWMAFHIVDEWKPAWKMWQDFQHHRAAALRLDALRHTHPIHCEVRTPNEATENFDLITYEKGASVVRMIERYLGAKTFQKGVRSYIRRHKESNATAADLWRALGEAAGEPVEPMVRSWIDQEGHPVLSLKRSRAKGHSVLALKQERFAADPRPRKGGAEKPLRWSIPWVGRVADARGRARIVRKIVTGASARVDLGPGETRFVYGNADEGGFFRPLHDPADLRALAENLPLLTAIERMGLVDHQWALVRSGRAGVGSVLDLAAALADEAEPDVLLALRGPLAFLEDRLAPDAGRDLPERFRDWIAARFGPALLELGWDPARGEPDDVRLRRAVLIGLLGDIADWPPVLESAAARFDAYLERRDAIDPNLADAVVTLAARNGDAARFDAMLAAFENAATPQERRRFLLGLAEFRAPKLVDRALALCLTDRVPTQDVAFVLVRLLANRAARERSWNFVKKRWPRLRRRMPPMLATRLVETTPVLGPKWRRDVAAFFRANPLPTGARSLDQALERFDLDTAFCKVAAAPFAKWLG
jgi:puromycin-sensitive aminopeptidase